MSIKLDAILGEGDFKRESGVEPSLLPLLARFASPAFLLQAAQYAELHAMTGVPAVERATALVIARRAGKMDKRSLYQAAARLPLIGKLADIQPVEGANAELIARIGARIGDADVVKRAIASAFGGDELVRASAAGLPLVGNAAGLLKITLAELPSISLSTLFAVAAHLDPDSNARLFESWLKSGRDAATIVAGIVEILPRLSEERREQAAQAAFSHITTGAFKRTEPWMVSYLVRRLRETERGAKAPELQILAQSLPSPWREVVGQEGRLEHVDDEAALESSHPYVAAVSGPILRTEADTAIGRMMAEWGGGRFERVEYRSHQPEPEELYLVGRVAELDGDIEIPRLDAFVRGRKHRVTVYLAVRERASGIIADAPAPLDRSISHELYISFFASWLRPTAPAPIKFDVIGGLESTTASVDFVVPPNLDKVALTVVLMERIGNELTPIQTGVLGGDVVAPGAIGTSLSFRMDPHPVRPPDPTTDGVTIVLGDDTLAVYGAAEVDGRFPEPGELKKFRATLGDMVLEWAAAVTAAKDATTLAEGLSKLALRGKDMLELLRGGLNADAETLRRLFQTDGTVRLWSRVLNADLPVEFIYDGDDLDWEHPALCAQFFEGLKDAACRKCENRGGTICAFDFWAFRRRIERRVMDNRNAASGNTIANVSVKTLLSITGPGAFGASKRVSPESRKAIMTLLAEQGIGIKDPAPDWKGWQTLLKDERHPLLVLLSHTEQVNGLEIEGYLIDRQQINENYVNPQRQQPGPLVLLTGCETARPEVSFLSFVSKFLEKGAAVVVGTLALILEDASAEATQQLLRALYDVVSPDTSVTYRTVGEVMRRTRCRLLLDQNLIGLNLVAYGNADWRFGREDQP